MLQFFRWLSAYVLMMSLQQVIWINIVETQNSGHFGTRVLLTIRAREAPPQNLKAIGSSKLGLWRVHSKGFHSSLRQEVSFFNHTHFHLSGGVDYSAVSTTLTFPAGATELTVPVDTIDDSLTEIQENFGATLSNPSQGVSVGDQSVAVVIITDNDESKWRVLNVHLLTISSPLPPLPDYL